jgi:hypothetical protein
MSGWTRVSGSWRAHSSGRAAGLLLSVLACAAASCNVASGAGGLVPVETETATGGSGPIGLGGFGAAPGCQPPSTASPVFEDQSFDGTAVPRLELYTWTTDEDAAELREARVLFSASSRAPAAALALLSQLGSSADSEAPLAQALSQSFALSRFAWPEPWAIRMGLGSADPGGQLIRIELDETAWFAVVESGQMSVHDAHNALVPQVTALAHPERIGAIFFDPSPNCLGGCPNFQLVDPLTAFRGFLVGNQALISEWSIGTQQIRDRLSANTDQLTRFLNNTRSCPTTMDFSDWNQSVLGSWIQLELSTSPAGVGAAGVGGEADAGSVSGGGVGGLGGDGGFSNFDGGGVPGFDVTVPTEETAYENALAIPSPDYLSAPAQIATMIQTLQGDLFEPDPLVVTPGSP